MKRIFFFRYSLLALLFVAALISCQKEITIDYHEVAPLVMIEGRVSNEGTNVLVTRTRSMNDSVQGECIVGANVTVTTDDGVSHTIAYNPSKRCYSSALFGIPGQSYRLSVTLDGHCYEATSTMPLPAKIKMAGFLWETILEERFLVYEVWAEDPQPGVRNQFRYRVDRSSAHPRLKGKKSQRRAYRSGTFEDRGHPNGLIFNDVLCMSEKMSKETKEDDEDWEHLLQEGDTIRYSLMTLDLPVYEYFRSLSAGQGNGANPKSNISGGCLGYFSACSITHAETVIYRASDVVDVSK